MARTKKNRLIQMAPHFNGFEPCGSQTTDKTAVSIKFEEYEAMKLCDYECLTHEEASILMNISRSTFTRIYESVRNKVAKAFIEGRAIVFEEGNIDFAEWHVCDKCEVVFTLIEGAAFVCPLCQSKAIKPNN